MGQTKEQREIERLLRESGAVMTAQGNHIKYELPDGRHIVLSKTPSDWRADRNKLVELRNLLGVRRQNPTEKGHADGPELVRRSTRLLEPHEGFGELRAGPRPSLADQLGRIYANKEA